MEENVWTYEEVTGRWRKLHIEELHNLCPSPNTTVVPRKVGWERLVARMVVVSNTYKITVRRREEKRSLGRPTNRCGVHIKTWL